MFNRARDRAADMAAWTAGSLVVNSFDGLAGVLRGRLGLFREGRLGLGGEGDGDGAGATVGAGLSVDFGLSLAFVLEFEVEVA